MKHLIVGALILCSVSAFAQMDPEKMEQRKTKMKEHLIKELNLNSEQIKKLNEIDEKYGIEEKPILEQKKQIHEKMKVIRDKKVIDLEKILTPEQKEKFKAFKAKMKDKFNRKKGLKDAPPEE